MQKYVTWICLLLLILIHTMDMELTRYYIGNNPKFEAFPPMSWCIGKFGIETSLWISRAIMYPYFWFALMNQNRKSLYYFLILVTILYWTAMIPWVFQLDLLHWPLPKNIIAY